MRECLVLEFQNRQQHRAGGTAFEGTRRRGRTSQEQGAGTSGRHRGTSSSGPGSAGKTFFDIAHGSRGGARRRCYARRDRCTSRLPRFRHVCGQAPWGGGRGGRHGGGEQQKAQAGRASRSRCRRAIASDRAHKPASSCAPVHFARAELRSRAEPPPRAAPAPPAAPASTRARVQRRAHTGPGISRAAGTPHHTPRLPGPGSHNRRERRSLAGARREPPAAALPCSTHLYPPRP